jgi:Zn-dependent protease
MAKERKVYTSFHDISPSEYMYFPKGTIDTEKPGKFSRIEIIHILISMGVLTVAFALALSSNRYFPLLNNGFVLEKLPLSFLLSFLAITIGFFFHEISHKFMAQKYGLWAEYRMFPQGLLLALFLSIFTGFVFAAPGAVMFMGGSRSHETGRIAMAGPLANIVIAGITLPLYLFVFYETELLSTIFAFICFINAFLATFNLLPFGPLDGTKIIRWSAAVWMIMLIISISLLMSIAPEVMKIF